MKFKIQVLAGIEGFNAVERGGDVDVDVLEVRDVLDLPRAVVNRGLSIDDSYGPWNSNVVVNGRVRIVSVDWPSTGEGVIVAATRTDLDE